MNLPIAPFGEIQTTKKTLLQYCNFHYTVNTELVTVTETNGGTVTQGASAAILQTGTNANGIARFASRAPVRYIPGQGLLIVFSARFSTGLASCYQAVGFGNLSDGLFFEFNGTEFGINRRASTTGEVINNRVTAANWERANAVPEFDPTRYNVYGISLQWLGAGEINFWIENRHTGTLEIVHTIRFANQNTALSLANPSLPLFAGISNTGNTLDTALRIGNMAAYAFGDREYVGPRQATRAALSYTTGAERVMLAIENMADVFSGTGNNRSGLYPTHISYATDGTKSVTLRVKRCTISGGTNAAINATTSIAKQYTGTPTVSNAKLLFSIEAAKVDKDIFIIPDDVILAPGEALVVTAESTANADVAVGISWKELL